MSISIQRKIGVTTWIFGHNKLEKTANIISEMGFDGVELYVMERFQHTANLLTVVQTCRRQGRSVIEFFEQSLVDSVVGDPSSTLSLIPILHT
ncbi:MAG: hypothetical protein F6K07_09440 [Okeania sp. SIO1H5]|uniref:hypothetical protein n=2 Tax=unclassified Okeania TaxID=2634635 RepID=UPI0013B76E8F|nr:hypothetical protein [Okeania sp. SIO1H5]NET19539.1 hypothetical protein [Okeania sp. SIO1H5]